MKKIAIVPTLLTLGNGICGFVAITFASKIDLADAAAHNDFYFTAAGWFIMGAMLFDLLDGYVARISRTASQFGGELDSLCDAISFGIVPAFLLLKLGPGWEPRPWLHQLLAGIAALYMACTLLRLARFNVENSPDPSAHRRFRGLPSPGAAGCIASLAILRGDMPDRICQFFPEANSELVHQTVVRLVELFSPIGALLVALLMVSQIAYPHVTKQFFRTRRQIGHVVQVLLGAFIVLMFRELALAIIFWGYALVFPVRYLLSPDRRTEQTSASDAAQRQV